VSAVNDRTSSPSPEARIPDPAPSYVKARCLVLGVGNIFFGDDGFGPAVAQRLEAEGVPDGVVVLDAGTGVRTFLFDLLLSDRGPSHVFVIDAVDRGWKPGELRWIDLEGIPALKLDDFSMHQAPTSNVLRELRDARGVRVEILACQSKWIPREMESGFSPEVAAAVALACAMIRKRVREVLGTDRRP
jgi:coenzyme F420 hydrogenase subunit delta